MERMTGQLHGAARHVRVRQAVEAESAQAKPLAPFPRQRVRPRGGRDRRVKGGVKHATVGTSGMSRCSERIPASASVGATEPAARAPRAAATTSSSRRHGSTKRSPPCTTRWPTASIPGRSRRSSATPLHHRATLFAGNDVIAVEQAQLEARRAAIDGEDAHRDRPNQARHTQSRTCGGSSPTSRVYGAGLHPRIDHRLPKQGRVRRQPGHAVDHVSHEVVPSMSLSITMSNGVVVVPSSL